jgi:hypothetical protein
VESLGGVTPVLQGPAPALPQPPAAAQAHSEAVSATFEAEWRWVRTRFPDAVDYRPAESDPLLRALLDWVKPGGTTTVFSRACRAVNVRREDDRLRGYVHRGFNLESDVLRESVDVITIGSRLEIEGCNVQAYERGEEGVWEPAGSIGGSCLSEPGLSLSKVTSEAAWYDDALVTLSVDCMERVEQQEMCLDGQPRSCLRCDAWWLSAHSTETAVGFQNAPTTRKRRMPGRVDCNVPCSPSEQPRDVARAAEILKERAFLRAADANAHPFVFRTDAACRAYRKQHQLTRAELDDWRGGAAVQSNE